ncbi:MAG: hypothetical protein O7F12_04060 [Nitrospirae bacterium]|nr:hypothetical protein [Nitrospirota bacterium]
MATQIVFDGHDRKIVQVYEQIKSICEGWAENKWGKSFTSTVHGRNLWSLVAMTLFRYQAFGMDDTLPPLYKLWKSRKAIQPSGQDHKVLKALLQRFQISKKTSTQVLKEAEKVSDPVLTLLDEFFAVRNRYWASFFDKDGKLRKKKLPNLPDARLAIVAALKNPKKHWRVKNGDPNIPPPFKHAEQNLTHPSIDLVQNPLPNNFRF